MNRAENELQLSVKKACSSDEVPPKRKHVRACIVYTWEHKNSKSFWNALKVLPLTSSEIKVFKALITIHKLLQEGHPQTLKEGYKNKSFIESLTTFFYTSNTHYGKLIRIYDKFVLQKLDFHYENPSFNGLFGYDEYLSLRTVSDPNEGYESILQLMDLQDEINNIQKLIFASITFLSNSLCVISALVPLITESYDIYKFYLSMLKAMHLQLGLNDALSVLINRFETQHFMLRDFYTDCNSIKFLTSLISIPKLSNSVPNLLISKSSDKSKSIIDNYNLVHNSSDNSIFNTSVKTSKKDNLTDEKTLKEIYQTDKNFFHDKNSNKSLIPNQYIVPEIENKITILMNQHENDQKIIQDCNNQINNVENELNTLKNSFFQQINLKNDQIKILEEQNNNWTDKYNSLSKLYFQIREEYLDLLNKFKNVQNSFTILQSENDENDILKKKIEEKNLKINELTQNNIKNEIDLNDLKINLENFKKDVFQKESKIENLKTEIINLQFKHNDESELTKLKDLLSKKNKDCEIKNKTLEHVSKELKVLKNENSNFDFQLDHILKQNFERVKDLFDIFLENNVKHIQNIRHFFFSSVKSIILNTSPEYILSLIEICSDIATSFGHTYNDFILESNDFFKDSKKYSSVILTSSDLISNINNLCINIKGLNLNDSKEKEDYVFSLTEVILSNSENYFQQLKSCNISKFDEDNAKIDKVIDLNFELQNSLQNLVSFIESLKKKTILKSQNQNLEVTLKKKMNDTEKQAFEASNFLSKLIKNLNLKDKNSKIDFSILEAAKSITDSVVILVKASITSQNEIISEGKNTHNGLNFYNKNSRWTEGLISAAKAVGEGTKILINMADGLLKKKNTNEELIVASNEVSSSTTQLVAASRVKGNLMSKTQKKLEIASNNVSSECKKFVKLVQNLIIKSDNEKTVDLNLLSLYEGKKLEMEQQVEILKLECKLSDARLRLGNIRKQGYKDENTDDEF